MINFEQTRRELGLNCALLIEDFHFFSNLDSYIELIENFLNYKIDVERFETNFYEMRRLDCEKKFKWETMLYIIDNLKLKLILIHKCLFTYTTKTWPFGIEF